MKNKLSDLNNYLFEQLERLLDDEICHDKESAEVEIARAKTVCDVSQQIVNVSQTQLSGMRFQNEWGTKAPQLIGIE